MCLLQVQDILDGEICGGYKDVIGNQNENESY